jgi:hypothetical protein
VLLGQRTDAECLVLDRIPFAARAKIRARNQSYDGGEDFLLIEAPTPEVLVGGFAQGRKDFGDAQDALPFP